MRKPWRGAVQRGTSFWPQAVAKLEKNASPILPQRIAEVPWGRPPTTKHRRLSAAAQGLGDRLFGQRGHRIISGLIGMDRVLCILVLEAIFRINHRRVVV